MQNIKTTTLAALVALTLAACGGGDEPYTPPQDALFASQVALYDSIQAYPLGSPDRASLVARYNTQAAELSKFDDGLAPCGTQKGREAAHAECMSLWNRSQTPLTQ